MTSRPPRMLREIAQAFSWRQALAFVALAAVLLPLWTVFLLRLREVDALGKLQPYAGLLQSRAAQGQVVLQAPYAGAEEAAAARAVRAWQLAHCRAHRPWISCKDRLEHEPARISSNVLARLGMFSNSAN